jgi:flagellar motor switch protein FliN
VVLDGAVLETPLMGEGVDQKAGWKELLSEAAGAAAGDLLAVTGRKCQVAWFEEIAPEAKITQAFQLRSGARAWTVLVRDEVKELAAQPAAEPARPASAQAPQVSAAARAAVSDDLRAAPPALSPGLELLLDVELEASLRFGSREMPLGEILDLGPGDVVELDRHVADPVDLIVGDKIVARGEVVLVNGNFGLRVTEVAAPRKRLESIRCLF